MRCFAYAAAVAAVVGTAAAATAAARAASDGACTFAEDLRGFEVSGLHAVAGVSSGAACKAACCTQANCTIWQYCGDFTTYCGAEHGGCWIGDVAKGGHRSKHCDGLDCWQGGCRGTRCRLDLSAASCL